MVIVGKNPLYQIGAATTSTKCRLCLPFVPSGESE